MLGIGFDGSERIRYLVFVASGGALDWSRVAAGDLTER